MLIEKIILKTNDILYWALDKPRQIVYRLDSPEKFQPEEILLIHNIFRLGLLRRTTGGPRKNTAKITQKGWKWLLKYNHTAKWVKRSAPRRLRKAWKIQHGY